MMLSLETPDPTSPIELIVFDIFDQVDFDVEIFQSKLELFNFLLSASDLVGTTKTLSERDRPTCS